LNPRRTVKPETVFETAAFDRSATPPFGTLPRHQRGVCRDLLGQNSSRVCGASAVSGPGNGTFTTELVQRHPGLRAVHARRLSRSEKQTYCDDHDAAKGHLQE
jgi:hypothetical protein